MLANRLFKPDIDCENPGGASRIATDSGRQGAGADSKASEYVSVEGQIEGSDYMGAAEALMEHHEVKLDKLEQALLRANGLLDYRIPTALDTPEIESMIVESNEPMGPYGAKEAGEGPLHPSIPAIANAIYDAVGVRIDTLPITPAKVLAVMWKQDEIKGLRSEKVLSNKNHNRVMKMGVTHVTVTVRNPAQPERTYDGLFLVDTGAVDCLVPGKHLKEIGLSPKAKRTYELADGSEVKLDITVAEIEFMGDIVGTTVIFGADDAEPILGVTALESVGIEVDPRTQRLKRLPSVRLK